MIERVEQFMFHQDHSACNPIQISVFEDKIYIWNDGEMPEGLDSTDKLFMKPSSKPYNSKPANQGLWCFERRVIGIWSCF